MTAFILDRIYIRCRGGLSWRYSDTNGDSTDIRDAESIARCPLRPSLTTIHDRDETGVGIPRSQRDILTSGEQPTLV